jgi:tocopherol cyclase
MELVNFHKAKKNKSYFEAWYFKHQCRQGMVAVIPGFRQDENGDQSAFIQVITDQESHLISYPAFMFQADRERMTIQIANNIFTPKGIAVHVHQGDFSLSGTLRYREFLSPKKESTSSLHRNARMPYHHQAISMFHRLSGVLEIRGQAINFQGGIGYVEQDWGTALPESYVWTQCSGFAQEDSCVIASVEEAPYWGGRRLSGECSIYYQNTEYRLDTNRGAKVHRWSARELLIQQGEYRFCANRLDSGPRIPMFQEDSLLQGRPACRTRYRFYEGNTPIFDVTSRQSSFEFIRPERMPYQVSGQ